jgi:hypothetical protein
MPMHLGSLLKVLLGLRSNPRQRRPEAVPPPWACGCTCESTQDAERTNPFDSYDTLRDCLPASDFDTLSRMPYTRPDGHLPDVDSGESHPGA